MQPCWQDVSIPISPQMTNWPGDPVFVFNPVCRMSEGASCNVSEITMSTHTGTIAMHLGILQKMEHSLTK